MIASAATPRRRSAAFHGRRQASSPNPASSAQNIANGNVYFAGYRERLNGGVVSSSGNSKTWRPREARPNKAAIVATYVRGSHPRVLRSITRPNEARPTYRLTRNGSRPSKSLPRSSSDRGRSAKKRGTKRSTSEKGCTDQ